MAKRSRRRSKKTEGAAIPPAFIGAGLLILAGITLVSFFTPNQGFFVAGWSRFLRLAIGWGRYVIWLALGLLAFWYFRRYELEDEDEKWEKPVGVLLLIGLALMLFHLIDPGQVNPGQAIFEPGGGGLIGWAVGELFQSALGKAGTVTAMLGLLPLALILISGLSLRELFVITRDLYYRFQDWRHFRQLTINQSPHSPQLIDQPRTRLIERFLPSGANRTAPENHQDEAPIILTTEPDPAGSQAQKQAALPAAAVDPLSGEIGGEPQGRWRLPPLYQIFDEGIEREISEAEIRQRVKIIEETLLSFGVEAKVREINQGPAVTQFSLEPGYMPTKDKKGNPRKVRVSRIVNLANDLALALAASPIRMEAPIPGRPYIGVEVPNTSTNLVTLRNLMESDRFFRARGPVKLALGQDVSGRAVIASLTEMPHLLVAGATGSGKSVCINAMIACMTSTHTPETLRLLMVDPKRVELINYNGLPHLLAPVVTELEKVVGVLNWATREMDRRYKLFSKEGSRNVASYNDKMKKSNKDVLPFIVIIIDELADLMMMAPEEVERAITRIAQMARATGIHLVIATQRPSVNVVTGLIKANFPARIAFAVSSQVDSRVILDSPGADRLLGKGDMLYMAPDASKLQRLQGAFVSDQELNRLVQFWRGTAYRSERGRREPVEMPEGLVQQPLWEDMKKQAEEKEKEDELLEQAIELVKERGEASVSLLQRRLRIGYARAARLIDEMEDQGLIGPQEGSGRTRPVLITNDDEE